jgi:hypothetical protein
MVESSLFSMDERQGMPGGIDILDYKSRVTFGCKLLNNRS